MASFSNETPAEGVNPPGGGKRIRNDRAKRSARQNELNHQKRKMQFAAAGVEENMKREDALLWQLRVPR